MRKPVYIATYHQSKFGKLMGMTVPEIIDAAIEGACKANATLRHRRRLHRRRLQFLAQRAGTCLPGLVAIGPGLAGKPIEAVENACASGGQAVLSRDPEAPSSAWAIPESPSATRRCATPKARWTASSSARSWATSPIPTSAKARCSSSRTSSPRSWRRT